MNCALKRYDEKPTTIFKSSLLNTVNAGGYGYASKAAAVPKSGISNTGNFTGWRKCYTGKVIASIKCVSSNACYAGGYCYASKAEAIFKCAVVIGCNIPKRVGLLYLKIINAHNAVWYDYGGKAFAPVKSAASYTGNAIGYSVTVFLCLLISTLYYS